MSRIARQEIYYGKHVTMDDIIKGVEKVTKEDVQRLAQQLFTRENIAIAMLGPLSKDDLPAAVLDME